VKVYAFDGTTYKGYSGTSGKDGQVTFTLPQGNYRFRGDLNGTQFWSSTENACTLPGCANATITLPGGNTSSSTVTINYTYDGLSRLTAANYSSGDYYHYAYDSVGNRLTETTAKGETAYTYDPANRLKSVNGQAVQWDDNGNMLADGQAVYKYNTANKLVGVTKGTSSIVYAYSGLGDRLKQIADGVTTDYTLDINAGLTQVLQDNTNKYVYGNARIAQIAETQTGYFLPDALGSMRQMTDPSADLTLAKSYDPYGNVVSSSGAGQTVYGYTGEVQSNGLLHLRARDYVSQLGRFTSRDTWEGINSKPLTINEWPFVIGNPINRIDPSGMCLDEDLDGFCDLTERAILKILPITDDPIMTCTPNSTSTGTPTPANLCPMPWYATHEEDNTMDSWKFITRRLYYEGASSFADPEIRKRVFMTQAWALRSLASSVGVYPNSSYMFITQHSFTNPNPSDSKAVPNEVFFKELLASILHPNSCGRNPFEGKAVQWLSPQNVNRRDKNNIAIEFTSPIIPQCGAGCQLPDVRSRVWLKNLATAGSIEQFVPLGVVHTTGNLDENDFQETYWMGVFFFDSRVNQSIAAAGQYYPPPSRSEQGSLLLYPGILDNLPSY
jgi:RHS repeat-associated protein